MNSEDYDNVLCGMLVIMLIFDCYWKNFIDFFFFLSGGYTALLLDCKNRLCNNGGDAANFWNNWCDTKTCPNGLNNTAHESQNILLFKIPEYQN